MKQKKSTNKELVTRLEGINKDGILDTVITNAKNNRYHDYKAPEDVVCGKVQAVGEIQQAVQGTSIELSGREVIEEIVGGIYDETPDEDDKAVMRADLPESMWEMMGLLPNT